MEVIGVTAFAPAPAPTYRFAISSRAEKLKLTLEDLKSKNQWSSGFLDDKEYVTGTNKIPNASLADYVLMFKDALTYLMDDADPNQVGSKLDAGKIRRKLVALETNVLQLELSVKIRVFQSAWTAKYLFKLEPVSQERIDILESKLRDVEDELEKTKNRLEEEKEEREEIDVELNQLRDKVTEMETAHLSVKKDASHVYLKAASKNVQQLDDKGQIEWSSVKGDGFKLTDDCHAVFFLVAGWYTISVSVYLAPQRTGTSVELRLNRTYFQSQPAPLNAKQNTSVLLTSTALF